jgi:putative peptide zinc metalloprotease protein
MLTAVRERVTVTTEAGRTVVLRPGQRAYVGGGDLVEVGGRANGKLTYRGGAVTTLCAGSRAGIDQLWTDRSQPHARVDLRGGRLVADTASTSGAFRPLDLRVSNQGHTTVNSGPARHTVEVGQTVVAQGTVTRDGVPVEATGDRPTCSDGVTAAAPPPVDPQPLPTQDTVPPPAGSPTAAPPVRLPPAFDDDDGGPGGRDDDSDDGTGGGRPNGRGPNGGGPNGGGPNGGGTVVTNPPTTGPTTDPPTASPDPPTPSPDPPTPSPDPPRDRQPPRIERLDVSPQYLAQADLPYNAYCSREESDDTASISASISDPTDTAFDITARFTWSFNGRSGGGTLTPLRSGFFGDFSIDYRQGQEEGGTVTVTVTARDAAGNDAEPVTQTIRLCTVRFVIIG